MRVTEILSAYDKIRSEKKQEIPDVKIGKRWEQRYTSNCENLDTPMSVINKFKRPYTYKKRARGRRDYQADI